MDSAQVTQQEKQEQEIQLLVAELKKINPEDINVPTNYDGPILEMSQAVNQDWLKTLLTHLSDQKRLHKRFVWILIKRVKEILDKKENIPNISLENCE